MAWLKALVLAAICFGFSFPAAVAGEKDPPKAEGKEKDPKDMNADECEAAGLCPVTRKPFKPVYHHEVDGKTYHFATREAREQFKAAPEKYGYKKEAPKEAKKDDKKKK